MDLTSVLEGAFPILWEVEGQPHCDLLKRAVVNQVTIDPHGKNSGYQPVLQEVPCIFSVAPARTDLGDDVINTNTSFYVLRSDIGTLKITEAHLILFKSEYYKVVTGGALEQFGIVEIRVMKGN